jgi:hypothetical protein
VLSASILLPLTRQLEARDVKGEITLLSQIDTGAPEEIRTPDPKIRSLMLKKPSTGRRRIDIRNRTWLSHGHPNPGTRVDVITSCLRSKIETNFVPTVSFAMGIADTDV